MKIAARKFFLQKKALAIAAIFVMAAAFIFIRAAQADPITYYFNNAVDQSPTELGNYWYDAGFADPALELPDFDIDEVFVTDGVTFDGDIIFNLNARNDGTVQGDAVFNDASINGSNVNTVTGNAIFNDTSRNEAGSVVQGTGTFFDSASNAGSIESDAFFHDSSFNEGQIGGDATFYNDLTDNNGHRDSGVRGSLTRHYTVETVTMRDFSPLTQPEPHIGDGVQPWTVIADAVEVDVTGAIYDQTTIFSEINGGTFVFPTAAIYYFNNAVDTNPAEVGNYWLDEEATVPAGQLPNFVIDEISVLIADGFTPTTFNGTLRLNGNAYNKGLITGSATFNDNAVNFHDGGLAGVSGQVSGNATFNDSSTNHGTVDGDAIFNGDLSEDEGDVGGEKTRHYTEDVATVRNFVSGGPWTVQADGAVVDVTGATFDETTRFEVRNLGSFIGVEPSAPRYYFNNEVGDSPEEVSNYWLDLDCSVAAGQLPDFEVDEVFIVAAGGECSGFGAIQPIVFNGDIIFNGLATNQGIVTGNAVFNDESENRSEGLGGGTIQGNAIFNDQSVNDGSIEGSAEFVGDESEMLLGFGVSVNGTKTRRYPAPLSSTRDFTENSPWTVIADGAVIDLTGASYDETTTFTTENGGSFIFPAPEFVSASIRAKTLTLLYDLPLDETSVPDGEDYTIMVNGIPIPVSEVEVSGSTVILTVALDDNASMNDIVRVSYTPGAMPLQNGQEIGAVALSNETASVVTTVGLDVTTGRSLVFDNKLYVISSGNAVKVIDLSTQLTISTISVGTAPTGIYAVNGGIYITNQSSNNVSVINPDTNSVIATIPVGTLAVSASVVGARLYVNNATSGTVSVINTLSNTVIATITVGAGPRSSAVVGNKLYVMNQTAGSVSVVNLLTNTVSSVISVGTFPRNPVVLASKLYIIQNGSIAVINTVTDTLQTTITLAGDLQPSSVFGTKLYVPNNAADNVAVINTTSDTVSTTINVGDGPIYSHVVGSRLYISNFSADSMSVINLATDTVTDTISLSAGPQYASSIGNMLYVSAPSDLDLSIINTDATSSLLPNLVSFSSSSPDGSYRAGQSVTITANFARALDGDSTMTVSLNSGASVVLDEVSAGSLSGTYEIAEGESAPDLSVSAITSASITDLEAHTRTNYALPRHLGSLSADNPMIVRNLGDTSDIVIGSYLSVSVGSNPAGVATLRLSGNDYIYAANQGSNSVSVIKTGNEPAVVKTISVGIEPTAVAVVTVSGTTYIYVANSGSDSVSVIDPESNTVVATIAVGVEPLSIASIDSTAYVANSGSNTVSVINAATNTVTTTVSVGKAPRGLAVSGTDVYVANFGDINISGGNYISVIDSNTNTVSQAIVLPAGSTGPTALAAYGNKIYSANYRSDTVSVIDTALKAVTSTITVGPAPRTVATTSNALYVTSFDGGTIWAINPETDTVTALIPAGHTPGVGVITDAEMYFSRFQDNRISILSTVSNSLRDEVSGNFSSGGGSGNFVRRPETNPLPTQPPSASVPPPAAAPVQDPSLFDPKLAERLKGRLLLAVQDHGRIWYVDTIMGHRYEVTIANAIKLFRRLSLGITNKDLNQVPVAGSGSGLTALANRLKGKLLLQVQSHGEIWYVDAQGQRHQITVMNILDIFRKLSLGITNQNLNKIQIGTLE